MTDEIKHLTEDEEKTLKLELELINCLLNKRKISGLVKKLNAYKKIS